MKKLILTAVSGLMIGFCANAQITEKSKSYPEKNKQSLNYYKDIKTGDPLNLRLDSVTGLVVNKSSGMPVEFFINIQSGDTVSSQGYVVNNMLVNKEGTYFIDETKVNKKGKQLWDVSGNKELTYDKSWPTRTDAQKKPLQK